MHRYCVLFFDSSGSSGSSGSFDDNDEHDDACAFSYNACVTNVYYDYIFVRYLLR